MGDGRRVVLWTRAARDSLDGILAFIALDSPAVASISIHTVQNWEQGRRRPEGPAIGLLRIAARHPRIIRENLKSAA